MGALSAERGGAMPDPIEVNYLPDGDDWQVTVVGRGQRMSGKAPGLIAARDRADQLVEKLAPDEKYRTVVHLLNGDAVQFTTAYLTARLAKPAAPSESDEPVTPSPSPKPATEDKAPDRPTDKATAKPSAPSPTPRANGADTASKASAKHD